MSKSEQDLIGRVGPVGTEFAALSNHLWVG